MLSPISTGNLAVVGNKHLSFLQKNISSLQVEEFADYLNLITWTNKLWTVDSSLFYRYQKK